MTLLEGLRALLVDDGDLTDLTAARIRVTQADESDAMPYVILHQVSDPSLYAMSGEAGLAMSRVQVDCVARSPLGALELSEAVRTALSAYRGAAGDVEIRRCHKLDRSGPDLSGPVDGSQVGKYRVRMDFMINYQE